MGTDLLISVFIITGIYRDVKGLASGFGGLRLQRGGIVVKMDRVIITPSLTAPIPTEQTLVFEEAFCPVNCAHRTPCYRRQPFPTRKHLAIAAVETTDREEHQRGRRPNLIGDLGPKERIGYLLKSMSPFFGVPHRLVVNRTFQRSKIKFITLYPFPKVATVPRRIDHSTRNPFLKHRLSQIFGTVFPRRVIVTNDAGKRRF